MGKVKKHLEGRTKQERKAVRKNLGSLKSLTVQSTTKARYAAARKKFYEYLQKFNLSLPTKREHLDGIVEDYIEYMWSEGEGRALISDTLAGLQDHDAKLRGCLPGSWRLLRTWVNNEIPARAPPMPEIVLQSMVGWALFHKKEAFASSLLLGFYAMLRTGELLGIRERHLSMTGPNKICVVSLGLTKGGKRVGAAESVTLGVLPALKALWKWKKTSSSASQLCSSPHVWRKEFSDAIHALHLKDFQFRPYSLRRGGATHWFKCHGSLDKLMIHGRWASHKTCRIYINEGLATLAEMKIPISKLRPFLTVYRSTF